MTEAEKYYLRAEQERIETYLRIREHDRRLRRQEALKEAQEQSPKK